MSKYSTSFVLGYHGCDKSVGLGALTGATDLKHSNKDFDWLGPGVYFWESDPKRALEWAQWKVSRKEYDEAFVIGAIINLGNCLDLLQRENLSLLETAYEAFVEVQTASGLPLPENKDAKGDGNQDKLFRFLDCAIIRHLHAVVEGQVEQSGSSSPVQKFDSVRGLFTEGKTIYPGGGFFSKSHTQISVINPDNIIGYFIPKNIDN